MSREAERLLRVIDSSGVAVWLETLLPVGSRKRQLTIRALLLGMALTAAGGRPGHLSRMYEALGSLDDRDQRRLGVITWQRGKEHRLTYCQVEQTFGLLSRALSKTEPDGRAFAPILLGVISLEIPNPTLRP